ncbi:MAG TPA: DUF4105 domain-containing protein [Gemmatimonadales bacterium]|nr:DUF4105 domain-containing protein [Gemmatimonadales bacterium]
MSGACRTVGRLGLWVACAWGGTPVVAAGQTAPSPAEPGAALTVYVMTMGPGAMVWERFGHNAIWVHDPVQGTDLTYNYGLFDFRQHNFVLRFVRGQMWYWMAGFPADQYLEEYKRNNRSVWVQELDLPPRARLQLQEFLAWNARPENRFYHYDYYRDNCSTRVRDVIDRVVGGAVRRATAAVPVAASYRFHTQRLTANDPLIYTGLLLALGPGVDRPLSAWEEMFLPLKLREHLRRVTISGPDGRPRPLVKSERTIFRSTGSPPPDAPPDWLPAYLLVGSTIGGLAWVLSRGARRNVVARAGFLFVVAGWALLVGLAGLVLAGLWGLTDHVMAYRNENLLQMSPLALLLLPFLFGAVRGTSGRGRSAFAVAAMVAGVSGLGLAAKLLPGFHQVNGSVIALALPAHLGVVAALRSFR